MGWRRRSRAVGAPGVERGATSRRLRHRFLGKRGARVVELVGSLLYVLVDGLSKGGFDD